MVELFFQEKLSEFSVWKVYIPETKLQAMQWTARDELCSTKEAKNDHSDYPPIERRKLKHILLNIKFDQFQKAIRKKR